MPLFAKNHVPIPAKDIISWCYDNRSSFDQDKPIFIDTVTNESISANQTYKSVRQLAAGFRAIGLQEGDCVCIHALNHARLYYPVLVLGILAAGGVFVGTNPGYTPYELQHALKLSKAKVIIAEPELMSAPKQTAATLDIPVTHLLLLADSGNGALKSWRTLLEQGERDWVRFDDIETAKNTTAFLAFSSGTTGLPKAAQMSHYNLIAQHTLMHEDPAHPPQFHYNWLGALPFFHVAQAPTTHTSALRSGYETFVMRRFATWEYLENIKKYGITRISLVPPMVIAINNAAFQDEVKVRTCLQSIVAVAGGAAPLDKETQARFQTLLSPRATFTQLLGMSELSCVACCFHYPERDSTASVGRFLPNLDVKLVDEDGNEIGPYDVRGELCVRGPTVIRGYLDNAEANARDWDSDGFMHTGDVALCDGQTKLWYIVDRKKELIKVRGFQVAPNELEAVLLANPAIADAAVIGVHSVTSGEVPRAYIVRREGATLGENEVKACIEKQLSKYKRLEGGVKFVESIPKTASGKILKRVLREEAKRELGAKL